MESQVKTAAEQGRKEFADQYGFVPDLWFAHVFPYEAGEGKIGAQGHWFFNPAGIQTKEITKNVVVHQERIDKDEEET